jgi:hypothetical protein
MRRRNTSLLEAIGVGLILLGLAVALAALLLARPAGAVGLLPSRFTASPWPSIQLVTPVSGEYMLIAHDEGGDRLFAWWPLEAGVTATIVLPRGPWAAESYHVQVMADPDATMILAETRRYEAHTLFLAMAGR